MAPPSPHTGFWTLCSLLPATDRDIIDWMRERLAHYKCPKSIDFVDTLPRNPSGKLLKRELRQLHA